MFIYNLNEKGLKKFEKDINEQIKEADYISTDSLLSTVSSEIVI